MTAPSYVYGAFWISSTPIPQKSLGALFLDEDDARHWASTHSGEWFVERWHVHG